MKKLLLNSLVLVVLAVVIFAVYVPVLKGDFIYDDIPFITDNHYIKDFSNVWKFFLNPETVSLGGRHHLWRPVRTLSFAVDYYFWGLNPLGYHIVNVLFHSFNAFCVYLLGVHLFSLFLKDEKVRYVLAFIAAMLFGITPLHTEAVSWISSRSDSMYSFFVLASVLCYIKFRNTEKKTLYYIASLFVFVLGLLSKESAFMLPFLIILYDVVFSSFTWKPVKDSIKYYVPFLMLDALYVGLRYVVLGEVGQAAHIGGTFVNTMLTMATVMLAYFRLLIWPVGLRLFYDVKIAGSFLQADVIGGVFLLYISIFLSFAYRKKLPFIGFCVGWFFINLFPASNIIPIKGWMGERLIYLSSVGFFLILPFFLYSMLKKLKLKGAVYSVSFFLVIAIVGTFFAYESVKRNQVWADEITFWEDAVQTVPDVANSWHNLGVVLVANGFYDGAEKVLNKTLEIDPTDKYAYFGIAFSEYMKRDLLKAKESVLRALGEDQQNAQAFSLAGVIFMEMGDAAESMKFHKKALELAPDSSDVLHNAGLTYQDMGLSSEAVALFEKAVMVNPDFAQARNSLGVAYKNLGKLEQACIQLKKAIVLKPDFASAYNNLGICYAALDKTEDARAMFIKAKALDKYGSTGIMAAENLQVLKEVTSN